MSQSEKSVQHSTNLIMKKHNKVGYRAILLFISFLLTGCATGNAYKISKSASQGRYDTAVNITTGSKLHISQIQLVF